MVKDDRTFEGTTQSKNEKHLRDETDNNTSDQELKRKRKKSKAKNKDKHKHGNSPTKEVITPLSLTSSQSNELSVSATPSELKDNTHKPEFKDVVTSMNESDASLIESWSDKAGKSTTATTTTKTMTTVDTTSLAATKQLPRVVVSMGLMPRQVARKKTIASSTMLTKGGQRATTGGSATAKTATSASVISTSITASMSTRTEISTGTPTNMIFRAKDIVRNTQLASSSSTSPTVQSLGFYYHNSSRQRPQHNLHYQQSALSLSNRYHHQETHNQTKDDDEPASLLKATSFKPLQPIVVHPEQRPEQVVFPYGNYPTYYEKRSQEQTTPNPKAKRKQDSSPSTTTATNVSANIMSISSSGSNTRSRISTTLPSDNKIKDPTRRNEEQPKWRQEEQYPKDRHRYTSGLSVLLPPPSQEGEGIQMS
ncbi:hypothetical protein BGX28_009914, partial [Mortierella sp. GBA30]